MMNKIPGLLETIDEEEIIRNNYMESSHPFWEKAKKDKFFALNFSELYGGMPMSATGISRLLQRITSCTAVGSVHVMVPNSLGPGELLTHYGTQKQKDKYLPRLANGDIPCFGLTSPNAGSDAAGSMSDVGEIYEKDGEIRIKITCDKRYITLAPVADIIGLAFKLSDPNNLLKNVRHQQISEGGLESVDGEITLALIERNTPGLEIGSRHDPLGVGFANGTIRGTIDIGIDQVIGEQDGLGEGWKMLMECLAAGRGISLPAGAAGPAKMITNTVGGYARIRNQFKMPIAKFEGIQEKLSDMALRTLEIDAMVALMNSMLDNSESPPVISAILKYRTTECARQIINHGMDIMGGSAICRGKQNFMAPAYAANPVAITVEGSNVLTRSMIVFGQGINRSHPYIQPILESIENDNVDEFTNLLKATVSMNIQNLFMPQNIKTDLDRFGVFFSLGTNTSLLLGGKLKKMEYLSGRYADILSDLFYGYALHWHSSHQNIDKEVTRIAEKELLFRLQNSINDLIENHPHKTVHRALYRKTVGGAHKFKNITDKERTFMSDQVTEKSNLRDMFATDVLYGSENIERINETFSKFNTGEWTESQLNDIRQQVIKVDEYDDYCKP
jgi:acyl-CoA dehydrogenase